MVGLDFGTTYSYCYIASEQNIITYDLWLMGPFSSRNHTVLQYDDEYNNIKSWGAPALTKRPNRRNRDQNNNE